MILCIQVYADCFGFALFVCFLFFFFFTVFYTKDEFFGKCTETHLQFELEGVGTKPGSLTSGAYFNPNDRVFCMFFVITCIPHLIFMYKF